LITQLEHKNKRIATQIFTVFQNSYEIEAQLIGVSNFPPLQRTVNDIAASDTRFYGFFDNECLAAIIEITVDDQMLDICSLTVEPRFFRKGIADKLVDYVLSEFEFEKAVVETAVANAPAIKLYKKHGFVEFKRWTPSHGIKKLAMAVEFV
jgi:ribosomal protein S18 acetylase RimI-like enzyme